MQREVDAISSPSSPARRDQAIELPSVPSSGATAQWPPSSSRPPTDSPGRPGARTGRCWALAATCGRSVGSASDRRRRSRARRRSGRTSSTQEKPPKRAGEESYHAPKRLAHDLRPAPVLAPSASPRAARQVRVRIEPLVEVRRLGQESAAPRRARLRARAAGVMLAGELVAPSGEAIDPRGDPRPPNVRAGRRRRSLEAIVASALRAASRPTSSSPGVVCARPRAARRGRRRRSSRRPAPPRRGCAWPGNEPQSTSSETCWIWMRLGRGFGIRTGLSWGLLPNPAGIGAMDLGWPAQAASCSTRRSLPTGRLRSRRLTPSRLARLGGPIVVADPARRAARRVRVRPNMSPSAFRLVERTAGGTRVRGEPSEIASFRERHAFWRTSGRRSQATARSPTRCASSGSGASFAPTQPAAGWA